MDILKDIKANWEEFARTDPLWSILPMADKKNNRWTIQELFLTGQDEIRSVMEHVNRIGIPVGSQRALDFGCGVGRLTHALADHFKEVWGVDISAGMIDLAEKYNLRPDRCRFLVNEREDLRDFPDQYFDLIYSNIVFQHIPPRLTYGYLREFLRLVKPNGFIVYQMTTSRRPGLATTARALLKKIAPTFLRRIYKKKKYGTWAIKDMYCIPEKEMMAFIASSGGRILDVVEDRISWPRFLGKRYVVTRA